MGEGREGGLGGEVVVAISEGEDDVLEIGEVGATVNGGVDVAVAVLTDGDGDDGDGVVSERDVEGFGGVHGVGWVLGWVLG